MKKSPFASVTLWVSLITIIIGALMEFQNLHVVPDQQVGYLISALGFLMGILRMLTGQPVTNAAAKRTQKNERDNF